MQHGLEIAVVVKEDNHGEREHTADDRFIAVALPDMAVRQRKDRNEKQQEHKKRYAPKWQY
jgi:acyl-CoA hydrolase